MAKTVTNDLADSALLLAPGTPEVLIPKYSDDEIKYLGALQVKLEQARNLGTFTRTRRPATISRPRDINRSNRCAAAP
jgi:hypothetical protein